MAFTVSPPSSVIASIVRGFLSQRDRDATFSPAASRQWRRFYLGDALWLTFAPFTGRRRTGGPGMMHSLYVCLSIFIHPLSQNYPSVSSFSLPLQVGVGESLIPPSAKENQPENVDISGSIVYNNNRRNTGDGNLLPIVNN